MTAEPITWSEEKFKRLQEQLSGTWAEEDIWLMRSKKHKNRPVYEYPFHFNEFPSVSLAVEFKYALWIQIESGYRKSNTDQGNLYRQLKHVRNWINYVAPSAHSLLERDVEAWVWSLRTYLVEHGLYHQDHNRRLTARQEYVMDTTDDRRICFLRAIYRIVAAAYDDRPETEKDLWDLRKLGLSVDLTKSMFFLNFTLIVQPWLRSLTKTFMNYRIAVRSVADCRGKLSAICHFSRFLAEYDQNVQASAINRALIMAYITYSRDTLPSVRTRNRYLVNVRIFLETCAYHLKREDLPKERIIFDDDLAKEPQGLSREIPEEVLVQIREHLDALPTTILRMVTILLEVGLRANELCTLPLECLICDDKHEWYLRFYQSKVQKEQVIPLVDEKVIGTIQAQQQEIRDRFGTTCHYLFPNSRQHTHPFRQQTFRDLLNAWAVKYEIKDRNQQLYRLTAHLIRHTVGMRLLNEDVPIEVVSRLLGHSSLAMTQVYARVKDKKMRADLQRAALKRKTIDAQGQTVKGDPRANNPDAQLIRKGVRGQTLPVGGCGRLIVLGDCSHANKCLTCPMWLTSTDDLPKLKSFYERAVRLKQRAVEKGNQFVIDQQEHILSALTIRIKSLEEPSMDGTLAVEEVLEHFRADLVEAEIALEEVRGYGLIPAAKYLERTITDLKAKIAALEEPA
jgi:integrase/recombinase XerD